MKLISLTCDHPSFKPLFFKPEGLSLIVGDASKKESSSNGVGKTLALKLVHHCLGASVDTVLTKSVPDWVFTLKFELSGIPHEISRRGDGKEIKLDQAQDTMSLNKLREWLNDKGPFKINEDKDSITFRALYKRFGREERTDRNDPVLLTKEKGNDALVRVLYLLGVDITLVLKKIELRTKQIEIQNFKKFIGSNYKHLPLILGGIKPESQLKKIQDDITRISNDLREMKIANDYEVIKSEADRLTAELREKESKVAIIEYQLTGIKSSLEQRPDISQEALSSFYDGLNDIFKPEALKYFKDVKSFHISLTKRRQERLIRDQEKLISEKDKIETQRVEIASKRDEKLKYLNGKTALHDYEAVIRELTSKEEEEERLSEFINKSKEYKEEEIKIKQEMADQNSKAESYLITRPIDWADEKFRALVRELYPQEIVGIELENNIGENKLRYDLSVQVSSDASDGINATRIVCFDWIIFMFGSHHNMAHLWHDNGLFDHIDPKQRAKWLRTVIEKLQQSGKQYIISINTENYESLLKELTDDKKNIVEKSVIVTLRGDKPKDKLLGIQIGS